MNKPPAFQFYPSDWLSSTKISLMTPAEEGGYIRLLCHAWLSGDCCLPNDDEILAKLSRLGDEWHGKSAERIKACFTVRGNVLINQRLKQEKQKQREWRLKSRQGGVNSGKSRKNKEFGLKGGSSLVETNEKPKANISSSSSSSSSNNNIPKLLVDCLEVLKAIPLYPFDIDKDHAFLQEKQRDYPDIDILSLLKGWKSYLIDKPLTSKSRPRSQLHSQFELAKKWGKHKKECPIVPDTAPSVLDKIKQAQVQEVNNG